MVQQAHHPEPGRRANPNDQNSKFKTSKTAIKLWISHHNVWVIGLLDLDIACPVK
jgi:hypothetical protein